MLTDAQPRQVCATSVLPIRSGLAHIRKASASWKTSDLVVSGEPQVAFDSAAELERAGEGGQAVLGNPEP